MTTTARKFGTFHQNWQTRRRKSTKFL